jgi:hypothetical protein
MNESTPTTATANYVARNGNHIETLARLDEKLDDLAWSLEADAKRRSAKGNALLEAARAVRDLMPDLEAMPPAPQPPYREKCAGITAKMLALRGDLFLASQEMMHVFRDPFWGRHGDILEDRKPFADAMNYAIQSFFMAVNKDLEAAQLLFNAYVEGEKVLNG